MWWVLRPSVALVPSLLHNFDDDSRKEGRKKRGREARLEKCDVNDKHSLSPSLTEDFLSWVISVTIRIGFQIAYFSSPKLIRYCDYQLEWLFFPGFVVG